MAEGSERVGDRVGVGPHRHVASALAGEDVDAVTVLQAAAGPPVRAPGALPPGVRHVVCLLLGGSTDEESVSTALGGFHPESVHAAGGGNAPVSPGGERRLDGVAAVVGVQGGGVVTGPAVDQAQFVYVSRAKVRGRSRSGAGRTTPARSSFMSGKTVTEPVCGS